MDRPTRSSHPRPVESLGAEPQQHGVRGRHARALVERGVGPGPVVGVAGRPGRRAGDGEAGQVTVGLEGRLRDRGSVDVEGEVVQEDPQALHPGIAGARDRHLDLLAGEPGQVDRPGLVAVGAAGRRVPLARGAGGGAAGRRPLVVEQLRVDRRPVHVGAGQSGAGAGVPVGVRKRRPAVGADLTGLDEHEVVVRLEAAGHLEAQRAGGRSGQVDRPAEALVRRVGSPAVEVEVAGQRVVRGAAEPVPLERRGAGELRELRRRQEARGGEERRGVVLVPGRAALVEVGGEPAERRAAAPHGERPAGLGRAGAVDVLVGAEPVLQEVVEQRQARVEAGRRALALLLLERVVEVRAVRALGELGVLAGVQQLAALVEVVADGQLEIERQLGGRARNLSGLPGDHVVAGLPDHRGVVRQHAQRVRGGTGVRIDVVHVGGVTRLFQRLHVTVHVAGARWHLLRGEAGGVLGSQHQHPPVDVVGHPVGEVLALDGSRAAPGRSLIGPAPGEPHLDPVAGPGAPHGPAELAVVDVPPVAVARATGPLRGRACADRAAVDAVVHPELLDRALGENRDRLLTAVRHRERVDPEVRGRAVDDRDRFRGVRGGPGQRQRERDVLAELRLDERLVVREVEDALAVLSPPRVVRDGVADGLAGRHLRGEAQRPVRTVHVLVRVAVRGVQLGGQVRVVTGHRWAGVGAGQRLVHQVVRGRRVHLESGPVQQQLGRGVVVHVEGEAHPLGEAVQGAGLRLGRRTGSAVGLARRLRRRALVVEAPVGREVPVGVDPVDGGDAAVGVVVAQVLAPEAVALGEGEVVTVGVRHRQEPQLVGVHQPAQGRVRGVAVENVVKEAADHLRGDPLPGVLRPVVEHSRP